MVLLLQVMVAATLVLMCCPDFSALFMGAWKLHLLTSSSMQPEEGCFGACCEASVGRALFVTPMLPLVTCVPGGVVVSVAKIGGVIIM